MSEAEFCKTLDKLQKREMREFVEAFKDDNIEKASRILESIGFVNEVSSEVCKIN